MADARAEYGEMNITKLNQRIDSIEVIPTIYFIISNRSMYKLAPISSKKCENVLYA